MAWSADLASRPRESVQASAAHSAVVAARQPARGRAAPATPARELVTKYCVTCHNERLKTANLLLDKADAEQVANSAETWEKVVVQAAQPGDAAPRHAAAGQCHLRRRGRVARDGTGPRGARPARIRAGRPDLHRLNRTEYANAVRDLLGVEIDAASMLPPDEQAYGFDTNADALSHRAGAARSLSDARRRRSPALAVGDPTIRPAFERYTAVKGNSNEQTWLWQTERLGEDFPLGSRGGIAARHYFPVDGEYVFRGPAARGRMPTSSVA